MRHGAPHPHRGASKLKQHPDPNKSLHHGPDQMVGNVGADELQQLRQPNKKEVPLFLLDIPKKQHVLSAPQQDCFECSHIQIELSCFIKALWTAE